MNIGIHHKYMTMAIAEAIRAEDEGEVPIGAVLVDDNYKVITKSHNQVLSQCDPTSHAEMIVLKTAARKYGNYRLLNTTMYVTVEPCCMCKGAIMHSRISKLVFGVSEPKLKNIESIYDVFSSIRFNHRIRVVKGIYSSACRLLIQKFFKNKRSRYKGA